MAILFISIFMISSPVFAEDEGTVENVDTMSSYEQTADIQVEYKSYGYYTVILPTKFDNSNQFKNNIKVKMDKLAKDRMLQVFITNIDENGNLHMESELGNAFDIAVSYGTLYTKAALGTPIAKWYADTFNEECPEITEEVHMLYEGTDPLPGGTYNANLSFKIICQETDLTQ